MPVLKHLHLTCFIIVLFALLAKCDQFGFECTTWDGNYGVCVEHSSCPGFQQALDKYEEFVNTIRTKSECYNYAKSSVCCGFSDGKLFFTFTQVKSPVSVSGTNATVPRVETVSYEEVKKQYDNLRSKSILFGTDRCGKQQKDNPYTEANCTTTVDKDEFSWLVHVVTKGTLNTLCNGILINVDTVLTTYDCGINAETVWLGIHRLNETRVCVRTSPNDDYEDCKESQQRSVKFISNPSIPELGILKLASNVAYNEYVRAICLPFEEDAKPESNQLMFISGWNLIDNEDSKLTKQKLAYRNTKNDDCNNDASLAGPNDKSTFCVIAVHNATVNSDFKETRGPLFYQHGTNWYLAGIQLQTVEPKQGPNKLKKGRILGLAMNNNIIKWVLDNIGVTK